MKAHILSLKPAWWLWQVSQDSERQLLLLATLLNLQLRNAKTGSTGVTESCTATPREPVGAPIHPSQGESWYMRSEQGREQLSTCTAFIQLPAFDGCSCLGGYSKKDQTCPNLLGTWVRSRCFQLSSTDPVLRHSKRWERDCGSQGVQSSFHEQQLLPSNQFNVHPLGWSWALSNTSFNFWISENMRFWQLQQWSNS